MKDVLLYQSPDDGNIVVDFADVRADTSLQTSVYLSLFGGNSDDPARGNNELTTWWGNLIETDNDKKQLSRLQYLVHELTLVTGNLRLFEQAAKEDLAWLEDQADSLSIVASIPDVNTLQLTITGELNGEVFNIIITETIE